MSLNAALIVLKELSQSKGPVKLALLLYQLVSKLENVCNVPYKLSVVRCIFQKAASFVRVVWGPLLNATKLLEVSADSFVADYMAQKNYLGIFKRAFARF